MEDRFRKELLLNAGIIAGSVLILGAALFFFGRYIVAQSSAIVASRTEIILNENSLDSLVELKAGAEEARGIQKNMELLLPPEEQLFDLPRHLDGLSRALGVVATFSFQGETVPKGESTPGYAMFSLGLTGPGDSIGQFLEDVEERSTRFLVVFDSIDYSIVEGGNRASVLGRAFFR